LCPPAALAAENLFLRKQLALYQERQVTPRRATNMTRFALVWLARWFDWRQALTIVKPDTFIRWHRQGFRLFWRWQSRSGRPRLPLERFSAALRFIHNDLIGRRHMADYTAQQVSARAADRCLRKATEMVSTIATVLEQP
jgi:hypothetical protein